MRLFKGGKCAWWPRPVARASTCCPSTCPPHQPDALQQAKQGGAAQLWGQHQRRHARRPQDMQQLCLKAEGGGVGRYGGLEAHDRKAAMTTRDPTCAERSPAAPPASRHRSTPQRMQRPLPAAFSEGLMLTRMAPACKVGTRAMFQTLNGSDTFMSAHMGRLLSRPRQPEQRVWRPTAAARLACSSSPFQQQSCLQGRAGQGRAASPVRPRTAAPPTRRSWAPIPPLCRGAAWPGGAALRGRTGWEAGWWRRSTRRPE